MQYSISKWFIIAALIGIYFTFAPQPRVSKMPPSDGFLLRGLQTALLGYSLDHDGHYPESLNTLLSTDYLAKELSAKNIIASTNLIYIPPKTVITNPYADDVKDIALMSYQKDNWTFAISIGGNFHYRHNKGVQTQSK